jgi:thiol-disulfide isomerase/thioredoxin
MQNRRTFLTTTALGAIASLPSVSFACTMAADEGPMPALDGAVGWLNSAPLKTSALRGKVVLLDVWTYSCINSLRQLPYLRSWAAKYKDAGLVVIGVHSPEFAFEKERANVERAVRDLGVSYPVAIDSNHGLWRALDNSYWPADYFVDAKGRIRRHHFGEGDYDEAERTIQDLLRENGAASLNRETPGIVGTGIEAPPDFANVRSPETYVGYERTEHFASRERTVPDAPHDYSVPPDLSMNAWGLSGKWTIGRESAMSVTTGGRIVFRFHSRDLHLVLGPSKNGQPVRYKVTLDGAAPGGDHGSDTAADGSGEVREPRLYQLVRQPERVKDRTFEIEFQGAGVQAYAFTFG